MNMFRIKPFLAVCLMVVASVLGASMSIASAQAESQTVSSYREVGRASFSKWGIPVYDAVLKAPGGVYEERAAFSLSLTYKLNLKGAKIAGQARKEIARQNVSDATLEAWQKQLAGLIPDVMKGDTLTGVSHPDGTMTLLKNGSLVGKIDDAKLARAFFGIWLGASSSDTLQREQLLGRKAISMKE